MYAQVDVFKRRAKPSRGVFGTLMLVATLLASTPARANDTPAPGLEDAHHLAESLCVACHGPGGHASSPQFPHLAGQQPAYIANQLRAFKSHKRADPDARNFMWGIAATLDEGMIDALANYFSRQTPPSSGSNLAGLLRTGERLFLEGDSSHGIPVCADCHGERAEGRGNFPRLAGQHSDYIARQLAAIQQGERRAPIMEPMVESLQPEQIRALAAYLGSL